MLLYNAIKCPDGTLIVSRHQHDFQMHRQKDGREYYVDVKNLLVVDLKLRHQLDTFIGKMKMDQTTLKRVFNNLSNSL